MRPLTEDETRIFFEKLAKFVGRNIKFLLDRKDEPYCFRLYKDRVYYVSERIMKLAACVPRDKLTSLGTCFGKFTKGGRFNLRITCLEHLHQFAKFKVWLKPSAEMNFLYGNHVLKSGVGRMTEGTPQHAGIVICSQSGTPLGFGVASQSVERLREETVEPTSIAVLHQADVGEYLRKESSGELN